MIYPHYLAPVPSMAVVQMQPDLKESGLLAGHTVARHTALRSLIGKDDRTACEYRTAHDVTLWPLEAVDAKYLETPAAIAAAGVALPAGKTVRAGLRLKFRVTAGAQANMLALDRLPVFIAGSDELPKRLYEQLLGNAVGYQVRAQGASGQINQNHDAGGIQRRGFDGDEALIPYSGRAFMAERVGVAEHALRRLRIADHDRAPGAHDAGFLAADVLAVRPEQFHVVEVDAGDDRAVGVDDIHRVEPPAEADLEDRRVGPGARDRVEQRERGEFEECQGNIAASALHALEPCYQIGSIRDFAADPQPLLESDQVRRGVDRGAKAGLQQDRLEHRAGRALAVRAGDRDHRAIQTQRHAFGDLPHALQPEFHRFRMQAFAVRQPVLQRIHGK